MEGVCITTPPRVSIYVTKSRSFDCGRNLMSQVLLPRISMTKLRKSPILRCTKAEQESSDAHDVIAYDSDYVANSTEIKELECGKSLDKILENQGIRIRRRPPTGSPTHAVGPFEFRLENEGNTPNNILEKIIWDKDKEVSQFKERKPLSVLHKILKDALPVRDFSGALRASYQRTGMPALIAEVKKASPSRGVLREDFDPFL